MSSTDPSTIAIDYERFFSTLPNPYIAFLPNDPIFTIVAENEAHAAAAFSDPANAVGKPVFEVFPDTSDKYQTTGVSDLLESFRKVIKTGQPDEMPLLKYDLKDTSGKFVEKWWRVTHYPVYDAAGTLAFFYQATEDITEQIVNAQQLELAKSQLDSALAIGLVSSWSWDIAHDTVIGDRNLAESFGVKPEQAAKGLPLKIFIDSIHPDDRSRVTTAIQNSITKETDYEQEYRTIAKDGTVRWVIARGKVQKDANDNTVYFLGVNVDITERKEAEFQLQEIKSMFDALFESTILCIAMADLNGNILEANKTFLKTFGYTRKDLKKGFTSQQVTPKKSRAITGKIYDQLRATGEAEPMEKEYIRKDGTAIPMMVGAAMLPGSDNRFMAFMLDISENKELIALNHAKDEFIGMASHQLRTPATVVKQYISLLKDGFGGSLSVQQQEFIDKAYNSNERQLRVVNDLLKTAQLDSKRFILKKQHVTVSSLVADALAAMEDVISHKAQKITINTIDDTVTAFVDRTEIDLVIVNLIENASKYSPERSTITVKVAINSAMVTIAIKDEGVGIAVEDRQRIFQKFTRADNELSDTVTGSGLGLYWVEQIVKLHGGKISVASKLNQGSTFTVSLPRDV